jgi:holo-[acyl-carrier protein] synthase
MLADLAGESGIDGFPWRRDDYGESMITLPGEVDGHRVRIGCDVMDIEDVQDSLATFGDRYLRKVFTASEIDDCQGHDRAQRLAARFAAKEAVIKAFAEPDMSFPLREIEVTRDGPLPVLRLSGTVAERAQRQGWLSSSLSLSHADCHAMAVVVVVCSPAVDDPTFAVNGAAAGAR